eukprot:m.152359 g.152359  ORF g.152359 m.152359 type:complete len:409 (+) comp30803_c0_seq1:179-1405(+)
MLSHLHLAVVCALVHLPMNGQAIPINVEPQAHQIIDYPENGVDNIVDDHKYPLANQTKKWAGGFQIHMFPMGQADSQLIIFPSGYTMLVDAGELGWNSCKGAKFVAERVIAILGHNHIDVGSPSHWHVDHLGYAGYGGFWCLIETGLLDFGKILDRDGGVWKPPSDGVCNESYIEWHNVGTTSGTAVNWICYATDPANHKIYNIREVAEFQTSHQVNPPDVGAKVTVVAVDGMGAVMKDGVTPVSGNHYNDALPPSENDFCIGFLIEFGSFSYLTAGDLDGEYATSSFGYTYNNVETPMAQIVKHEVDMLHLDHHGSSHSSNEEFMQRLKPLVSLISCGYDNNHNHPAQAVLDRALAEGDVYLNNICALDREYKSSFIGDGGDVVVESYDNGRTFSIGRNTYYSKPQK